MDSYVLSSLLFLWLILFSGLGAVATFVLCVYCPSMAKSISRGVEALFVPGLVLASMLLLLGQFLFRYDMTFPVGFGSSLWTQIFSLMGPAFTLFVCSGLMKAVVQNCIMLHEYWIHKPCAVFIRSLGLSVNSQLAPVIILQSFTRSWSQSISWVFGEILIVESIFNVPGIGYTIWTFAKERQISELWNSLWILLVIYLGVCLVNYVMGAWLGKKLESYV